MMIVAYAGMGNQVFPVLEQLWIEQGSDKSVFWRMMDTNSINGGLRGIASDATWSNMTLKGRRDVCDTHAQK